MQVSAFGNDRESDHLDNWEVQFSGSAWMQDSKARLPSRSASCIWRSLHLHKFGRMSEAFVGVRSMGCTCPLCCSP